MKKFLLLLSLFCGVFTACQKEYNKEENNGALSTHKIELSQNSFEVDYRSSSYTVYVTSPCFWEAKSKDAWIVVENKNGSAGTQELSFKVKRNEEKNYRQGVISFTDNAFNIVGELHITQNGISEEDLIKLKTILYTSSNDSVVEPYKNNFGAKIVSNTYKNGQGVITFDAPVTSIGYGAFGDCSTLTSITLPNSVTFIGNNAFYDCSNLTSITIPDSVTSIGDYAFEGCSSMTSATIGSSVTRIGDRAFRDCSNLTSITIPDSVIAIGYRTFYYCSRLESVTIGDSVSSVGIFAFEGCSSLIGFYGKLASGDNRCLIIDGVLNSFARSGLTEYSIPNSVTSIGDYALYYCSGLISLTIPDSVTSIGEGSFSNCKSLLNITIPDSVTSIGKNAFNCCEDLTSVTIGNRVTSIGDYAFERCSSLTNATIGNSVTSIGNGAFCNCTSLTNITIPNSVTSIGISAFEKCCSLTSLTIGNNVISIGSSAFNGCTGEMIINSKPLVEVDYDYDSHPTHSGRGWLCDNKFTKLTIGDDITKIGDYVFFECKSLKSVIIGNRVTSIGNRSFYNCGYLTSVTIPDSVTSIEGYALWGCSDLTSVTIPDSVTSIGPSAFEYCHDLDSVNISDLSAWCKIDFGYNGNPLDNGADLYLNGDLVNELIIPSDITEIKSYTFIGCDSLTDVTISDNVTSIGEQAFYDCKNLVAFHGKYASNDNLSLIVNNVLRNFAMACGASEYTIPDGVTAIGDDAFEGCSKLSHVTIPSSVTLIGKRSFCNCDGLTNVYCKAITPPVLGDNNVFCYSSGQLLRCKIYVPIESVSEYRMANKWNNLYDRIVGYKF